MGGHLHSLLPLLLLVLFLVAPALSAENRTICLGFRNVTLYGEETDEATQGSGFVILERDAASSTAQIFTSLGHLGVSPLFKVLNYTSGHYQMVNSFSIPTINGLGERREIKKILRQGSRVYIAGVFSQTLYSSARTTFAARFDLPPGFSFTHSATFPTETWFRNLTTQEAGMDVIITDASLMQGGDIVLVGSTTGTLQGHAEVAQGLELKGFIVRLSQTDGTTSWVSQQTANSVSIANKVLCRSSSPRCYVGWLANSIWYARLYNMDTKVRVFSQAQTAHSDSSDGILIFDPTRNDGVLTASFDTSLLAIKLKVLFAGDDNTTTTARTSIDFSPSLGFNAVYGAEFTDQLYLVGQIALRFHNNAPLATSQGFLVRYDSTGPDMRLNIESNDTVGARRVLVLSEEEILVSGFTSGPLLGQQTASFQDVFYANFGSDSLLYSASCTRSCEESCPLSLTNSSIGCDSGATGTGSCVCPPGLSGPQCQTDDNVPTEGPVATPPPPFDGPRRFVLPLWAKVVIGGGVGIIFLTLLIIFLIWYIPRHKDGRGVKFTRKAKAGKFIHTEVAVVGEGEQAVAVARQYVTAKPAPQDKRTKITSDLAEATEEVLGIPVVIDRPSEYALPVIKPASPAPPSYDHLELQEIPSTGSSLASAPPPAQRIAAPRARAPRDSVPTYDQVMEEPRGGAAAGGSKKKKSKKKAAPRYDDIE